MRIQDEILNVLSSSHHIKLFPIHWFACGHTSIDSPRFFGFLCVLHPPIFFPLNLNRFLIACGFICLSLCFAIPLVLLFQPLSLLLQYLEKLRSRRNFCDESHYLCMSQRTQNEFHANRPLFVFDCNIVSQSTPFVSGHWTIKCHVR